MIFERAKLLQNEPYKFKYFNSNIYFIQNKSTSLHLSGLITHKAIDMQCIDMQSLHRSISSRINNITSLFLTKSWFFCKISKF